MRTIYDERHSVGSLAMSVFVCSLILSMFTPPLRGDFRTWVWSIVPVLVWGGIFGISRLGASQLWLSIGVSLAYGIAVNLMLLPQLLPGQHGVMFVLKSIVLVVFSTAVFVFLVSAVVWPLLTSDLRENSSLEFRIGSFMVGILIGSTWNLEVFLRFADRVALRGFPWNNGIFTLVEGLYLSVGLHAAFLLTEKIRDNLEPRPRFLT